MANERSWDSLGPLAFTANGGADGVVTIASTHGMRVKQQVIVASLSKPNGEAPTKLEIKRVLSFTKLLIGPITTTGEFISRQNLSAYTTADMATIKVIEQKKNKPTEKDIMSFVYEAEPVVALRTFPVDEQGQNYTQANPFPTIPAGTQIGPNEFDEVRIIRDSEDYPITYEFYLAGTYIRKIDVEYNVNRSAIIYKGSGVI
jgi:hypothetical protein